MFLDRNYAVMRHVKEVVGDNNRVTLCQTSALRCVEIAATLVTKIPGKTVALYHSPKDRARLTAELVRETLTDLGVPVNTVKSLTWLDCYTPDLSEKNIRGILSDHEHDFVLFVTHMSQVCDHVGWPETDKKGPPNCAIFAMDFQIP